MVNKRFKSKKGDITMETVFFILMGMVFAGLLIFGFNKIFFIQETMSEQEKQSIRIDIENAFEKCLDPLNRGSVHYEKIQHESFNAICLLGDDASSLLEKNKYGLNKNETKLLYSSDFNGILIKSDYFKDGKLVNPQIIEQLKLGNSFDTTTCYFYDKTKGGIELKIKCS